MTRSAFVNFSFFGIRNFWRAATFRGVKVGKIGEPSGDGDGGKVIVRPCLDKQSEQGRRQLAARQSKRDKLGQDGSKEGFP